MTIDNDDERDGGDDYQMYMLDSQEGVLFNRLHFMKPLIHHFFSWLDFENVHLVDAVR